MHLLLKQLCVIRIAVGKKNFDEIIVLKISLVVIFTFYELYLNNGLICKCL